MEMNCKNRLFFFICFFSNFVLSNKETSNHENSNKPFRLLDIGVGDGLALIGTLSILKNEKNWNRDSNVDLIEPSSMSLLSYFTGYCVVIVHNF